MPPVIEHPPLKPITKHEFKAPLDMLEKVAEFKKLPMPILPVALDLTPLLGTWFNVDVHTRGIPKLEIKRVGNELSLHVFGACTPTFCDWGVVPAMAFADNVCSIPAIAFSAQYKFGFKETLVVGRLQFGALFVETFDHFIDGSGRADYNSVYIMSQDLIPKVTP
jgi:hypothetical protein